MEDPVATCVHAVLTFGWILIIFLTFSKKIVYENTSKQTSFFHVKITNRNLEISLVQIFLKIFSEIYCYLHVPRNGENGD